MVDELFHYGTPRRSGRYPYGSGDNPYQHESWYQGYSELKNQGKSKSEIEKSMAETYGMSSTVLRQKISIIREQEKAANISATIKLREKGYGATEIGRRLGLPESTVRGYIKQIEEERTNSIKNTANALKAAVDNANYIYVGMGTDTMMGISRQKLNNALQELQDKYGYEVQNIYVDQQGNIGKKTTIRVLAKPGTSISEIYENKDQITLYSGMVLKDGNKTVYGIEKPSSVDSSRLMVRYPKDGGTAKDGVIEIRRGVEDLSLGSNNYAQVRIAVDGTHYLKGMAVYSDGKDMPDGVDIIFNTSKPDGTPVMGANKSNSVLKPLKDDPDNPFGALIKTEDGIIVGQRHYIDENGNSQLSPINIVREEGDWNKWSKSVASQMLSKQYVSTAKKQLGIKLAQLNDEMETNKSLTNTEVRRKMLLEYADKLEGEQVDLKAAAFPRQATKVILPLTTIKDGEIYAPGYENGEQVALVRYPHGGVFEMPVLTVNNTNKEGANVIGKTSIDAVGIGSKAASQLSGADFDGDTVLVIPTKNQLIKSGSPLAQLKNFEPHIQYKGYEGMEVLSKENTQTEMGKITNLITDMTIRGASSDELARAVKHSMVIIDANKHELNYKQSEIDNQIKQLKVKYQGAANAGASTLISQAGSDARINEVKPVYSDKSRNIVNGINVNTGEKVYQETGRTFKTYKDKNDKDKGLVEKQAQTKTYKILTTDDAYTLSSGTLMESVYADYANKLKAMTNECRKEAMTIVSPTKNKDAAEKYSKEVSTLTSKLNTALKNKPYENLAQVYADTIVKDKIKENPSLKDDKDQLKKVRTMVLNEQRTRLGASKKTTQVYIDDDEWEAIQANAVSPTTLRKILANADSDRIKELATPRNTNELSSAKQNYIRQLASGNYTLAEIAAAVGCSVTTVSKYLK